MPVKAVKKGDRFRVVESDTGRIAKNKAGSAIDGGGHSSKGKASKQASAVNISQARKQGARIPKRK